MPVEMQGTGAEPGGGNIHISVDGTLPAGANDSELYSPTTSSLSEGKPVPVPGGVVEGWLITTKPLTAVQARDAEEQNWENM